MGGGEGGWGRGILEFFCEKRRGPPTSWNGLMHDPSETPKQKHLILPPPLPIEDKNNRKLKIANWKCYISHSAKITLYTLFTDVNLFTGVIETTLTKFANPQFHCITRRFTHHCPSCRHVQLRKQTDPTKNRFGELSCFKSEVRNHRDQISVFSRSSRSQLRRSIFAANNRKKNVWHPG